MKPPSLLEKLDDAINPIVVKELRQAVHSRFVVAVVLMFLILQLVYLAIHLTFVSVGGRLDTIDYQAGRDVFTALQVILLATCMLFLPAYTGARLAAERSEVNTDLLFITTLQPRKIISGKLASAVVLAIMIFSACAPFMAFTYFLRGIDLPSIFFVVILDFLVVIGSVHVMVFLSVIPANRVLKAFLGVIGFAILVFVFGVTLSGTIALVQFGMPNMLEDREFWIICGCALIGYVGLCGILYSWAVGLICAPSANRTLPMRAYMLAFVLVSGVLVTWFCSVLGNEHPFSTWVLAVHGVTFLCLVISVNERERWSPRIARTIPKNWLLRVPAFLLYSGAAGGVLFACLLAAIGALGLWAFENWSGIGAAGRGGTYVSDLMFNVLGIAVLYTYCYAMTAVLVRCWLLRSLPTSLTWIIMVVLVAVGSLTPFLFSFLLFYRDWNYHSHFYWLLTNPGAAMFEYAESPGIGHGETFLIFAGSWAALVTVLNVPGLFGQVRAFRP